MLDGLANPLRLGSEGEQVDIDHDTCQVDRSGKANVCTLNDIAASPLVRNGLLDGTVHDIFDAVDGFPDLGTRWIILSIVGI